MNWFAFSQNLLPIVANPSAHILDQLVLLGISTSVAQFHIIVWFLVYFCGPSIIGFHWKNLN